MTKQGVTLDRLTQTYRQPLFDLISQARAVYREHWIEDEIQLCSLLSIKTGKFKVQRFKKAKVLFMVWPEPLIVAGQGTAIDDAMTMLWMENTLRRPGRPTRDTPSRRSSVRGLICCSSAWHRAWTCARYRRTY